MSTDELKNWQKKQAFNIVSQLPDEAEQAWAILGYVVQMVMMFFGPPPSPPASPSPGAGGVISFQRGARTPKRRASSTERPSATP